MHPIYGASRHVPYGMRDHIVSSEWIHRSSAGAHRYCQSRDRITDRVMSQTRRMPCTAIMESNTTVSLSLWTTCYSYATIYRGGRHLRAYTHTKTSCARNDGGLYGHAYRHRIMRSIRHFVSRHRSNTHQAHARHTTPMRHTRPDRLTHSASNPRNTTYTRGGFPR